MVDVSNLGGIGAQQSDPSIPGLYQMATQAGADKYDQPINPSTGGPYDPKGLLMYGSQYRGLFDPSGEEDRIRTASVPDVPFAPWINQPLQGRQMMSVGSGLGGNDQPITAGAAPKYIGGDSANYPGIFNPRAPRTGWFTLNDYYGGKTDQTPAANNARFSAGGNRLSTNDWRLLPPGLQSPNYFMMNGQIIDRIQGELLTNPSAWSVMGQEGNAQASGVGQINRFGGNETGYPRISWSQWNALTGIPGQLGGWSKYATENY